MDAKDALLEGLLLLYDEEYRALTAAAEILELCPASSPSPQILRPYFDITEEHLFRLKDLFEYLQCSTKQVDDSRSHSRDQVGNMTASSKLFLVGKMSISSDLIETFLRLDRSVLQHYRNLLGLARAFGANKVLAMLLQSFRESIAIQQLMCSDLRADLFTSGSFEVESSVSLASRGVR